MADGEGEYPSHLRHNKEGEFSQDWGLKDQIRRSAGSVMHNIAEGFDGGSNIEFLKFLRYAQRSCREVQSQLYVALDEEYVTPSVFEDLYTAVDATHGKIGGFIKYLKSSPRTQPRTKH